MNCINPSVIENPKTRTNMLVPCRKCTPCRISKLAIKDKLCREEQNSFLRKGHGSSFVTLTYNEGIPHCGLCPVVYRNFLKRFRINLKRSGYNVPIKFVGCGEYGDTNFRPHYHFIFFGLDTVSFVRDILRKSWPYGFIQFGALKSGGIRYVLDYVMSHSSNFEDDLSQSYVNQCLYPPFHSSSRGIGSEWLKEIKPFYQEHGFYYDKGKPMCLPTYYADRLGVLSDKTLSRDKYDYEQALLKAKGLKTSYNAHGRVFEPVFKGVNPSPFVTPSESPDTFKSIVENILF